jgi:radical SAM superfamily enzyme YgiQ (UPF0313 family)
MNIRLVEPKAPGLNVFDQALLPRLGLPLIGRILRDAGHNVRIYVETLAPVDWADVAQADLVGFSATSATAPAAYQMAERCRRLGIPTVMGGSHVTFLPEEALDHCDLVVRGEGQTAILEVIEALQGRRSYISIAGLSYRDAVGIKIHTPPRPHCSQEELAALPAPDLSLIVGHERMTNIPIMTQWGCPFDCDFCGVIEMFGRKVRARKIEDVLAELETFRGRGAVFFYDDNFVVSKERTRTLLRAMIERGLTPSWSAQMRAEVVYKDKRTGELDHELLGLMRDSGCRMVYCGFESVNPATLEVYNKHQDVKTIRDAVRAFHAYSIGTHGMFVLGSDADDVTTFGQTVKFALENKIDTVQFMMLTPCPGTAFYERIMSEGRLLSRDWSLYDGHHCVIQPAKMTPYELQIGTYKAMAQFYSARHSMRLLAASLTRNLPFLFGLFVREKKFRVRLPRIALMSLIPSRRPDLFKTLSETLSPASWQRVQDILMVPVLRFYALQHIRQWSKQARSRAHLQFLRRLPPRPNRATGAA